MKGPCGNPVSRGLHRCDGPENTKMEGGVPDNGRTLCAETSWRLRLCARERARKAYGTELLRRDVMETAAVRTEKDTEIKDGGQLAPTMAGRCAQRRHGDSGCAHGKGHGKHMEWSCCAETSWRQRLCARERPRRHLYNAGDGRI